MEENQNNPGGLEDNNTQQNNTENMYSYRDNSQNIQESGAIRRSMGDVNPSNVNYFTNKFNSKNNYNNNNIGQFENSEIQIGIISKNEKHIFYNQNISIIYLYLII